MGNFLRVGRGEGGGLGSAGWEGGIGVGGVVGEWFLGRLLSGGEVGE